MRYPLSATASVTAIGVLLLALCSFVSVSADHHLSTPSEGDLVPLFDGTFEGWRKIGGKANYRVEDGAVVGSSVPNTPNTFLCTERHYGDFVLEYEFLVDERLNSGVQIRSNSLESYHNGRVHGYQVEIDPDLKRARLWSAGIYDEARRGWLNDLGNNKPAREAFRGGEWNHIRVVASGDSIKTWINGVAAADLIDSMTLSGFVGLQVHGVGKRTEPMEVRWRNLRIQDLGTRSWQPLLLGDLDGWARSCGGEWQATSSGLTAVGSGQQPGYLVHSRREKDVTLHVEYRVRSGRAGLLLRAQDRGEPGTLQGLLVDVGGDRPGSLSHTGLSDERCAAVAHSERVAKWHRPGEWNHLNVSVRGSRVTVHVNHREVVSRRDVPWTTTGWLALVVQPGAAVDFRAVDVLGAPVKE